MARSKWKKQHKEHTLRSGLEKRTAEYLDRAEVPYGYESETLTYEVPAKTHKYKPDFTLQINNMIVECKGRFDAATRQKMAYVIEQNPERDIRLLFMRDNTISKNSKTKYSDWCDKRGIKYHVSASGEVPKEWYDEATAKPRSRRKRRSLADLG